MLLRLFHPSDTEAVVQLWRDCGLVRPWNDPYRDIERKMAEQPELFLVGEADVPADPAPSGDSGVSGDAPHAAGGTVVAAAMIGYDGHRGWVNYLAVSPDERGAGLGRALMARAEELLTARGCPKLNLQVRAGNDAVIGFYRSLGYEEDGAISMGKRLIPDI
jgi:ribosomal protein S18 acetylase RimI-like enzyme